jgi:uncharacterized protein YecT (DUF1311 family)
MLKRSLAPIAAILATMPFLVAHAEDAAPDPCADKMTQAALNSCYKEQLRAADEALDRAYQTLMQRFDRQIARDVAAKDDPKHWRDKKDELSQVQRAWLDYRTKQCRFIAGDPKEGGSMYPMVVSSCAAPLTVQRTRELEFLVKCGEADTDCPVPRADD